MYGLKRLIEIEEEKKRKREEREKRKKEKEEAIKAEKRLRRKKRLKKKQNQRAYAKRKQIIDKEREMNGDSRAFRMVLLVKNHKRVKNFGWAWWKTNAYDIYNKALKENRETVKFPVKIRTSEGPSRKANKIDTKWELIMVEKIEEDDDAVTQFRNDDGKFINVEIVDNKKYKVIARDEWFVEEHFHVYGYHPKKNRKTYSFILNELILKKATEVYDVLRINTLYNKVIISHSEDFDFIICKNSDEADRLCTSLQREDNVKKNKHIVFLGNIVGMSNIKDMYNKIEEKTGWDRRLVVRNTVI